MPEWPHAPIHRFNADGTFFVTAGTYQKQHFYRSAADLNALQDRFFESARKHDCGLEAWCLFSNHYHVVANGVGEKIRLMLSQLHSLEGHERNAIDGRPGRKVWYQFRETQLTFERSWMARLRYTHENAVHHPREDCHCVSVVFGELVRAERAARVRQDSQELRHLANQRSR